MEIPARGRFLLARLLLFLLLPLRFLARLAVLRSSLLLLLFLLPRTVTANSEPYPFVVGDSAMLICDIGDLATDDSVFMWVKGWTTIFEDERFVANRRSDRYKVEKSDKKYTIEISGLEADDNGAKFTCEHNDGREITILKTYALELSDGTRACRL